MKRHIDAILTERLVQRAVRLIKSNFASRLDLNRDLEFDVLQGDAKMRLDKEKRHLYFE